VTWGRRPIVAERAPAVGPRVARLVIVDDHELARAGLRGLVDGEPGLEVVGEAAGGREALSLCRRLRPDLVLMDIRMQDLDGLAATRALKQELPGSIVLIVTMHENPDYLAQALSAGAAGYVLKGSTRVEIITAVRQALNGESPLPTELAGQLLKRLTRAAPRSGASLTGLTPRELQVLRLVAQGKTNPQIGRELLVSPNTIKIHVERIIAKLGVSDRTQAAVRASDLGLLDPPPS
jgi:DNA-binding NarL/FixJ family response regulator